MTLIKYVCGNDSVYMEYLTEQAERFERSIKETGTMRDYDDACLSLEDALWNDKEARAKWGNDAVELCKVKQLF